MLSVHHKGQNIYNLVKQIFPYCRSITGEGVRRAFADLKEYIEAGIKGIEA